MKTMTPTMTTAAALTMVLWFFGPALAQATDADGYGDGYQSGAYGRVRFADAGATIVRADTESDEPESASVNAPLFPGDTLRTDRDQRVEVQLAGGSAVRIDYGGEVVFQSLPNASAKFRDNTVVALNAGVIRITSRLGEKEEFRIDTRDASVYLLGEGEFRIATDDRGGTRVASLRGVAEVVGNDSSVLVRGGMRTTTIAGSAPETPRPYSAFASDGFDRWCDARDEDERGHDRHTAGGDERKDVPDDVRPYYGELSNHGSWTIDPDYGNVWYPTGVANDWRPYNDGYWSYGPGGYFWVSYEPWGWAPYHYGNWQWTAGHRWCWVPGPVFAGAWVSWSWGLLNVGWAPLDFWGLPGWIGGPLQFGFYDPGCWTFVNYSHIHDHDIHRVAVPIDRIHDDLRHATVVARGPRVDPRRIAESPVWRDRALRQVANDHAARMRPTQTDRRPERRLSVVQDHLMRRPSREAPKARTGLPSDGRSLRAVSTPRTTHNRTEPTRQDTIAPRPRRIFDDPHSGTRSEVRPETRDGVRDLYQRMSRPRETRGQDAAGPRPDTPPSRTQQMREAPGVVRPRAQAPQERAPRAEAPRSQGPRQQAPRAEAPRSQAPRQQAPRQQAAPQAKPKRGDKN